MTFCESIIKTPLGDMWAKADNKYLYELNFISDKSVFIGKEHEKNDVLKSISDELNAYFLGKLKIFKTGIFYEGTSFQKLTWCSLINIPYAQTISYTELALRIKNPKSTRAVGTANSRNPLSIIIPCHRVINKNGQIGGYAGGIANKEWLLKHEQKFR